MAELSLNSQGVDVRRLQELLNNALDENPPLKVDGIFGPKTRARVISFQKKMKLAPDGIVGPKTGKALAAYVLFENMDF